MIQNDELKFPNPKKYKIKIEDSAKDLICKLLIKDKTNRIGY